jgi:hypothetical protein
MDGWEWLRTLLVVLVWVTVAGGALMATLWTAFGGFRAYGPADALLTDAGVDVTKDDQRETSFSSAQVFIHGLLGISTAGLVTYVAFGSDDRFSGYVAALVALVLTAAPGAAMFYKWRSGEMPRGVRRARRVEDRFPRALVYLHGLGALSTLLAIVVLLLLE